MHCRTFLTGVLFLFFLSCFAQEQQNIFVTGKVFEEENSFALPGILVVNKRTGTGSFADNSGSFSITAFKTDTILISAQGYQIVKICFKDSSLNSVFEVKIMLQKLLINLNTVDIYSKRDLNEIERDINHLKTFQKRDYMVSGIQAVQSPITFLYQSWSRTEKSKRKVIQMRIEDNKRDLLREMLFRYSLTDVIELPSSEYDDFIDFCNVSNEFLQTATQYQIILFFKQKFKEYSAQKK